MIPDRDDFQNFTKDTSLANEDSISSFTWSC